MKQSRKQQDHDIEYVSLVIVYVLGAILYTLTMIFFAK